MKNSDYLTELARGMQTAWHQDVAFVTRNSTNAWNATANALEQFPENLRRIRDADYQEYLFGRFLAAIGAELKQLDIVSDIDQVTRDCFINNTSDAVCVATGMLHGAAIGLEAAAPSTYLKAACLAYVTALLKDGQISPHQAVVYRNQINHAFAAFEIFKVIKVCRHLSEAYRALKTEGRKTAKGLWDMRYAVYDRMVKKINEAAKEALDLVTAEYNELRKKLSD